MRKFLKRLTISVFAVALALNIITVFAKPYPYNDVMLKSNKLNPNFGNSRVCDIAMLASHDALSDKITKKSKLNPYDNSIPPSLAPLLKLPAVGQLIKRFAKTQKADIGKQLCAGTRYIDARITCIDGIYYTYHSVLSDILSNSLIKIINFLLDNPGEFIVFDIQEFKTNEKTAEELAEYISTITVERNGQYYNLYNFVRYDTSANFLNITYNDTTDNGTKAGIMFLSDVIVQNLNIQSDYYKYFKYKEKHALWHNESSSKKILPKIDALAKEYLEEKPAGFRCNQAQTTPSEAAIIKGVFKLNSSCLSRAKKHNMAVIKHENFDCWLRAMPIIWLDNVTSRHENFNTLINEKILAYNVALGK